MEVNYKLHRLRALAENDDDFLVALAKAFLEEVPSDALLLKQAVENKNRPQAYQISHKMKPTIDVFELGVLDPLIEIQVWGKLENVEGDVSLQLVEVLAAIDRTVVELKEDFNL